MVQLRASGECEAGNHSDCPGGSGGGRNAAGEILYGGWSCTCPCHNQRDGFEMPAIPRDFIPVPSGLTPAEASQLGDPCPAPVPAYVSTEQNEAERHRDDAHYERCWRRRAVVLQGLAEDCFSIAEDHGFWEGDPAPTPTEKLALVHTEVSECVDGLRHGNPPDDHIPQHSSCAAEMADTIIRCLDLCVHEGWPIVAAIQAKMAYNRTRPYKHGKKF
jgi:hypothetical protein